MLKAHYEVVLWEQIGEKYTFRCVEANFTTISNCLWVTIRPLYAYEKATIGNIAHEFK